MDYETLLNQAEGNPELMDFLGKRNLSLDDAGNFLKMIERCNKIPFDVYLKSMIGPEAAKEILSMTKTEKEQIFIIIDGRGGPTGKSTLSRILQNHGYRTLELYQHKYVRLEANIQRPIKQFSMFVE